MCDNIRGIILSNSINFNYILNIIDFFNILFEIKKN